MMLSLAMQCVPLYSLLAAVSARTVNYLSLDIEGVEFEVSNLYNSNMGLSIYYVSKFWGL